MIDLDTQNVQNGYDFRVLRAKMIHDNIYESII